VGICPANPTSPNNNAEPVSWYTSQLVATRVIQVPISEILCPVKNSLKLRCRNARHAWENRPSGFSSVAAVFVESIFVTLTMLADLILAHPAKEAHG
jgi:hypothetical protein